MHKASVFATSTKLGSRTPPEHTRPTTLRIATVADATPVRSVLTMGTAPSPVLVSPFSAHRLVAETGRAG